MKRKRFMKLSVFFLATALLSSANVVKATTPGKMTNNNNIRTQTIIVDTAPEAVDDLFTDSTHTKLLPGITKTKINAVRATVNLLFPSELKTSLLSSVSKADNLLIAQKQEAANVITATESVNDLFSDEANKSLREGITLKDIKAAKRLVDKLADPLTKKPLKESLVIACKLFDILDTEIEVRMSVDGLFTDSTHTVLQFEITQDDINDARSLIDGLTNITIKEELVLLIDNAQGMLDLRNNEQEVRDSVYALFNDAKHTTIKTDLKKEQIYYVA